MIQPEEVQTGAEIPATLRHRPQWVLWRSVSRNGDKPTKIPYQINGAKAKANDPSTWSTYEAVCAVSDKYSGIGYEFSEDDPYCGVDFDGCMDPKTGKISPWAATWIRKLDSYSEISPSGTGVKVWCIGKLPSPSGKKINVTGEPALGGKTPGIEIYDHARYFAVTGMRLNQCPAEIQDRQRIVDELHKTFFADTGSRKRQDDPRHESSTSLIERARRYVETIPGAVSGESGHNTTYHVACILILGFSLSEADALILLREYNQRCKPAWTERELIHKIEDADKQAGERGYLRDAKVENWSSIPIPEYREPVESNNKEAHPKYHRTDSGNAQMFAAMNSGEVKRDHRRNHWLLFRDHRWQEDTDGEIVRLMQSVAKRRYELASEITDLEERKREANFAIQSESRSRIISALSLTEAEPDIADSGNNWNKDPLLLCTGNGVLLLNNGTLRQGLPSDRITLRTAILYNPTAKCQRWEQFLAEIFLENPELIDFSRRAVGYSMTGETSEQVLFLCYGTGANGKSVFLSILREVFGEYSYNMPFSTIELHERSAIPNDLAALVDRRFVTAAETNATSRLNEARVKALTGGDPITARFLHCEYFTFKPAAKFWLAVNHKPKVADDSYGFWRRVRLIPFAREFRGSDADPKLEEKLRQELPGILAWAVRGCLEWQRSGLNPPDCVTAATEQYRQESDPLAEFIAERCTEIKNATVTGADFYRAYAKWAGDRNMKEAEKLSSTAFGTRMGQRFENKRGMSGKVYYGVGLRI